MRRFASQLPGAVRRLLREHARELASELAAAGASGARRARGAAARLWPPGPRHAASLFAAAVAALGLYGMSFYSTLPERLPSLLDWRSAAALLARDARPGDAVALAPWWAERAREVLPPTLPVLAFPRLAADDLLGVRRVWLLALPAAPGYRGEARADLAALAAPAGRPVRLGAIELTRFDLAAPALPRAFLPDRLAGARVELGSLGCAADARGAFRCPGAGAPVVSRQIREVDGLPRPCLVVQPPAAPAAALTITFPAVPMGRALRGHAGIVGEAALRPGPPLRLSVNIDGRRAAAVEAPPGPGWHPLAADTAAEDGRTAAVALTLAPGAPGPLCLDAYTLP